MTALRSRPARCYVTTEHNGFFIGRHHCNTHLTTWYGSDTQCPHVTPPPEPTRFARLAPGRDAAMLIALSLFAGVIVAVLVTLFLLLTTAVGAL